MQRIISVFICLSVILLCATSCTNANNNVVSEGTANESKWLKLSDNTSGSRYFVDVNGKPVNLFGMARCQNHADSENYIYSALGDAQSLPNHFGELGCNFMRLAIEASEICQEGGGVSVEKINKFITNKVDPDVQAIIASGTYVMLDIHEYPPVPPEGANGAQYVTKWAKDNYIPLLRELAKRYANEPMVAVIELWNEPYPADQTTLAYNRDEWNELVREYYFEAIEEVRKYDKNHVLLVSDWNAGWGACLEDTWDGYYQTVDPLRNTAFSVHVSKDQLEGDGFTSMPVWWKNVSTENNICLIFGEIQTESGLIHEEGIKNLTKFFSDTKDEYHFAGVLWRPHGDEANYVYLWKDWVKDYTTPKAAIGFRKAIEIENLADESGVGELVSNDWFFGIPENGTGVKLMPGINKEKYYESPVAFNKYYSVGEYCLTVTAMGDTEDNAGFKVGYKTASGKIYEIATMNGNSDTVLYDQTVRFKADENIESIVFFSNDNSKKSVAIDRVYLMGDSTISTVKK